MFRRTLAVAVCVLFTLGLGASALAYNQNSKIQQMGAGKSDSKKKIDSADDQDPYSDFNGEIKKIYEKALQIQKQKEKKYKVEKDRLLKKIEQLNKQKEKVKDTAKQTRIGEELDKLERQVKLRDQYSELPKLPENKLNDSAAPAAEPK